MVEPDPLTELSVDRLPLLDVVALDWLLKVPLLLAVCAMAPPATREATRRPSSLLMMDLRFQNARHKGFARDMQPASLLDSRRMVGHGKASQCGISDRR